MKYLRLFIVFIFFANYLQTTDQKRRGKFCRSKGGRCLRKFVNCEPGYIWSPKGKPYCRRRKRSCCYKPVPPPGCNPAECKTEHGVVGICSEVPVDNYINAGQMQCTGVCDCWAPGHVCPDGFKLVEKQCFKVYNSSIQYEKAKVKCEHEHLILGEPKTNATFIKLAKYVNSKDSSASSHYWLGARGDNSGLKWENGPGYVPADAPWMPGQPEGVSSTWCLDLRANTIPWTEPLASFICDNNHYFICEYVLSY